MGYFENRERANKKRIAGQIQTEKRQGSLGPNVPILESDPQEPEPGSQWIVEPQTGENPQLKAQIGETTYTAEMVPEGGGQGILVGESRMYLGSADPPGGLWMIENGRLLDRAAYPEAYAVMQTTYNTGGETSAQFRIPDQRSRVPIGAGQGAGLTNRALGARGGAETHVLLEAELALHVHSGSGLNVSNSGTHEHELKGNPGFDNSNKWVYDLDYGGPFIYAAGNNYKDIRWSWSELPDTTADGNHAHTISGNVSSAGSGTPHNNMQPWLGKNFICRVMP